MKKIFALLALAAAVSACYKDDLREMHEQIVQMRDIQVASLQEQAAKMEVSLKSLDTLTTELRIYVEALKVSTEKIQTGLEGVKKTFNDFKTSTESQISSSLKDYLATIRKMDESMNTQLDAAKAVLVTLQESDASMEKQISDLRTYLDGTFATKDWATGTLATLKVQNEILKDIETAKEQIKVLKMSSEALNEMLKKMVVESVDKFEKDFSAEIAAQAKALTEAYEKQLAEMVSSLTNEYTTALEKAIDVNETEILRWISEKLYDYYTVASAKAQIEAFKALLGNVPEGKTLQGEIDQLNLDIASVYKTLTEEYTKAIIDAVKDHEGKVTAEMDTKIQKFVTESIDPLAAKISPLKTEVTNLWSSLAKIEERINTVDEQIASINTSLAVLTELKVTLKEYMETIQAELEKADQKNREILESRLSDLRKVIASLQEQITSLKSYVGTLPEGEKDVTSWIAKTFETLNKQFEAYAKISEVEAVVKDLQDVIDTHSGQISTLNGKLDTLIEDSKEKIEGWISEKLSAYTDKAGVDVLLSTLESELNELFKDGDKTLQTGIDQLKSDLETMKTTIEEGYKAAIKKAIEDEDGKLTSLITEEVKKINDEILKIQNRASTVKGQVEALEADVKDYQNRVGTLRSQLESLQKFLAATGYSSLKEVVDDLDGKLDYLAGLYPTKDEFKELKEYVEGELSTRAGLVQGYVARMLTVKGDVAKLSKFLEGSDLTGSLKTMLDDILGKLDGLEAVVFKTDEHESLQTQINEIDLALYGPDKQNPSENSVYGMINRLNEFILSNKLSSITYVPKYLDQREIVNFSSDGNSLTASFTFLIRPSSLAELIESNKDMFKMCAVPEGSIEPKPFSVNNLTVDSDGTVEISVSDSSTEMKEMLVKGANAALFVTSKSGVDIPEFTSKFIPLQVNGTEEISVDKGNIHFAAMAESEGEKSFTVHSKSTFTISSFPTEWLEVYVGEGESREIVEVGESFEAGNRVFYAKAKSNKYRDMRVGKISFKTVISGSSASLRVDQDGSAIYSSLQIEGNTAHSWSESVLTFTLYNIDEKTPYIALAEHKKYQLIDDYLFTVEYLDGDTYKPYNIGNSYAVKASKLTVRISLPAGVDILALFSDSYFPTYLEFYTLEDNTGEANEGSRARYDIVEDWNYDNIIPVPGFKIK